MGRYVSEWHHNASSFEEATEVSVTEGSTTIVDEDLVLGGTISGTVTDSATLQPISTGSIEIYDLNNNWINGCGIDEYGHYEAGGLPTGNYKIRIDGGGRYVSEWHHDASTFEEAVEVTVTEGSTTTVDEDLILGGTISGTVTDSVTLQPIGNVNIQVCDPNNEWDNKSYGWTDEYGHYEAGGLPTGNYKIRIDGGGRYISEWHHDASTFEEATEVFVTEGRTTTIDEDLAPAGIVSGTVTDAATLQPIGNVYIQVCDPNNEGDWKSIGWTDEYGHYEAGGLPTGQLQDPHRRGGTLRQRVAP